MFKGELEKSLSFILFSFILYKLHKNLKNNPWL